MIIECMGCGSKWITETETGIKAKLRECPLCITEKEAEQQQEEEPVVPYKKRKRGTTKKEEKKRRKVKYTPEIIEFIRKNIGSNNKEGMIKLLKSQFGIDCNKNSLANLCFRFGIKIIRSGKKNSKNLKPSTSMRGRPRKREEVPEDEEEDELTEELEGEEE